MIISTEDKDALQNAVNKLEHLSTESKLVTHIYKAKIMIFKKGGHFFIIRKFVHVSQPLEIVNNFKYFRPTQEVMGHNIH
jgi:hypothetical protein